MNEQLETNTQTTEPEASRTRLRRVGEMIMSKKIWPSVAIAFALLCILSFLNEVLDLPHLLLGAARTPINWPEVISEIVPITLVGVFVVLKLIRDITVLKRAEEREQEAVAATAAARAATDTIEAMGDGLLLHNMDGRITNANPAFERMMGYETGELIGKDAAGLAQEIVKPEDLEMVKGAIATALEGKALEPIQLILISKEGREVPVLYALSFIRNPKGKPTTVVVLFKDITEFKRTEEALRESKQWLSTTLRSIGDAVIATDADGLVTFMNPVAEKLTGWDEDGAAGKPMEDVFNIINEQTGEPAENPVERVLREGVVVGLANHTVLIAKDGTKRPIADSGAPLRDEAGNIIGTVMVFRDITERRRAEEALRESEERLSAFMNSAPAAFIIYDSELNLAEINEFGVEMLGLGKQDIGKNMLEISPGLKGTDRYDKYLEVLKTGKPFSIVDLVPHPKFGDLHLTLRAFKVGESLGFIVTDITELKRMEEELVRKEKLVVLGQLAGGVGHELRNPLGVIKNAAYFLNMALEEPDPEVKETLEILEKEVATSEKIISSLLGFARPHPPTRRKVDINHALREALSRVAVPENVEVVQQLDETLPVILADPDQLVQVFGNIILNGAQAMPEGGRLVVRSEVPSPEWVAVSFKDTGVGIPEKNLEKLFEPLFTTKARGIGLGLPLTKTLVEGHGGAIEVESEVGKGSTFTVRLPVIGEPDLPVKSDVETEE